MMHKERESQLDKAFRTIESAIHEREEEIERSRLQHPFLNGLMGPNAYNAITQSYPFIEKTIQKGQSMANAMAEKAKGEINKNPYVFIGKVALCSLAVGLIVGYHLGPRLKSKQGE